MDYIESVKRLRQEHPELGLVGAKRMIDNHDGNYHKAKAACMDGRMDAETELRVEIAQIRALLSDASKAADRLLTQNKRLRAALEEIRELHVGDIDGSMEPGDDRFRGNKAGETVQIIDAVL